MVKVDIRYCFPDFVLDENNNKWEPVAGFADGYGGFTVICTDDHCYVVLCGSINKYFKPITHLTKQIVREIQKLPLPS